MATKKAPAKRKAAAKKAPAKKAATKKAAARKAAKKAPAKKAPAKKAGPVTQKMTKTGILNELAARTELTRKQVDTLLTELESLIERHISKRGVGEFTLPGLLKVRAVKRPATKKRMGRNPATGEEIVIPAKPATTRVRVTPLKRLKEMVS
ncbi:MAG TPA: HU family DNA-binding protein [Pseudomonadales bacterium]